MPSIGPTCASSGGLTSGPKPFRWCDCTTAATAQSLRLNGGPGFAAEFAYCLKRHVEVDGDQHGPAAKAILAAATADDPARGLQVLGAARQSMEARIKL
jgi:Protein of unknown function (DUF3050)